VEQDGKVRSLTLRGEAVHQFVERAEGVTAAGGADRAVRHYAVAKSVSSVAGDVSKRELSADRRLTLAVRSEGGTLHVCPAGPFTREDLELVGEHFDTLGLPALLPDKEVKAGDTWAVGNDAVQHACHLDGLVKNELKGTLTAVTDGAATFTLAGQVEGVERGAMARLTIRARGTFDVATSRVTALSWEQVDDRDQGPVSPASELTAKVTLARTPLKDEPKELSAEARAKVPADKIPTEMTHLRHADRDGKYTLTYPRDWTVVGRTADHLVMRLTHKGEFATQATVSAWKRVEEGKHTPPAEFKAALAKLSTWQPVEVLADAEETAADGRWVYKLSAKGKQDGADVVQTFYLLAGPNGDQVAVTFLTTPERAVKLADREAELLKGVGFPPRK
jgi:hypothetical protein